MGENPYKQKFLALNEQLAAAGYPALSRKPGVSYKALVDQAEAILAQPDDTLSENDPLSEQDSTSFASPQDVIHAAFDPGNRSILFYDGQTKVELASTYSQLIGDRAPQRMDRQSALITLQSSEGSPEFNDWRYVLGTAAQNQRKFERVYNRPKFEESLLYLLPCVAQAFDDRDEITLNLHINATEADVNESTLKQKLLGTTRFHCEGRDVNLKVAQVTAFEEGLGAFFLHQAHQPTQPGKFYGVLNLGGATLDALLCDHQGYVYIDNSFRSPKGGAFDLCIELKNTIAAAYEQARHIPIDFFMDAVKSGDYTLNGDYDFTDLVQPTVDSWFRDLLGNVKAQWETYFHRIDRYVITGGGAYLVKDKLANLNRFHLAIDPIFDNVVGIYGRERI